MALSLCQCLSSCAECPWIKALILKGTSQLLQESQEDQGLSIWLAQGLETLACLPYEQCS